MAKKKIENEVIEDKFTKEQIVNSKLFKNHVDLLKGLLEKEKQYSLREVKEIVEKFMKGKV